MIHDSKRLAARRAALIAQCERQRVDAAGEVGALLHPLGRGSNLRLPLTIAGVVLGMIASKPGRAMPIIAAGLSLWKLARGVLSALKHENK
jgi:hypothetical protein